MLTKWLRSPTAAAVAALFANGEPGSVFIAQKPSEWGGDANLVTMYTDNLGTTPVTALEQTVGLHLDTRPILLGPELVTNGRFNTDLSGWTTGSDPLQVVATWDASQRAKLTRGTGGNAGGLTQTIATRIGATYRLGFTCASGSGVAVRVDANQLTTQVSGVGTFTYDFTATATTAAPYFWDFATSDVTFLDNISVREVISAPNTVGQPLRSAQLAPDIGVAANYTASGAGAALSNPVAGQLKVLNGGAAEASAIIPNVTVIPGASYEVTATLASRTGTGLGFVIVGDVNMALGSGTPGSYRSIIKPGAVGTGIRVAVGTATLNDSVTISALSVKIVYGNHRRQSSAPARARLSARYNKVTARNANPVDLTNVTFTNATNGLATCTVVNDAVALAAAGLSGVCTLGNVYKLDNTLGADNAFAKMGGVQGNANSHQYSVWARVAGVVQMNRSGVGSLGALTVSGSYVKGTFTGAGNATSGLELAASAGAVVYFILPDLRESCYSYLPTPQTIIGTGATAADYDDTGFPARLVASGAQGYAGPVTDFSGSDKAQLWFGGTKLSDAAGQILYELGPTVVSTSGTFALIDPGSAVYEIDVNGGTRIVQNTPAITAPNASVLSVQWDCAQAVNSQQVARNNGASIALTASGVNTGAGPFSASQAMSYFSRGNTGAGAGTLNFIGDEFISIVRGGATPDANTISYVERFSGQRMGIYL